MIENYPCEITLTVYVTDGERIGQVEYELPAGKHPTVEDIREAIDKAVSGAREAAGGEAWRACTRREFWDELNRNRFGQVFAMPGPENFEEPE